MMDNFSSAMETQHLERLTELQTGAQKAEDVTKIQLQKIALEQAELVNQRKWLLHWLLFIVFKTDAKHHDHPMVAKAIDLFVSEKYSTFLNSDVGDKLIYFMIFQQIHPFKLDF